MSEMVSGELLSAEGVNKVHCFENGDDRTLCGLHLAGLLCNGMAWFTAEELAAHPDRPCKTCCRAVSANYFVVVEVADE